MIRKIALLVVLAAFAVFLMGCVAPEYQFCCYKDEALNDTAPVCKGMNESGEEVTLDVVECSEEDWMCTLVDTYTSGENEGQHKVAPICPNVETVPCNTTCAGVFCGSFFYDPRPIAAGYGLDEAHAQTDEEEEDESGYFAGEPMGLWNAQCVVKNMTPLFLRQLENSDNIVMNKFRFGVGNSFQDFEDAQYYFPLTDEACYLNAGGSVDRYTVYALSGALCPLSGDGETYVCTYDSGIHSKRFYDCALRCNIFYLYGGTSGGSPSLEPFNPYLSNGYISEFGIGEGLPFYSGIPDKYLDGEDKDYDARAPGYMWFGTNPDYPLKGSVLYGATFGHSHINTEDRTFMSFIAYYGQAISRDGTSRDIIPRLGKSYINIDNDYTAFNYLAITQGGTGASREVFFTAEEDPHAVYPWLLAHHSIYNKQFEDGHFLASGEKAGGAEFECVTGADCLSGYCNNFEYARGACVDSEGNDILCDCKTEQGKVVCMGAGSDNVNSWDVPSENVHVPVSRSAAVDYVGETNYGWGKAITSLPSIGKVVNVQFLDGTENKGPMPGLENKMPLFVLYLGGPTSLPDYKTRTWDSTAGGFYSMVDGSPWVGLEQSITATGMMLEVLNPCLVFPQEQRAPWNEEEPLSFGYSYQTVVSTDVEVYDPECDCTTTEQADVATETPIRFCCDGTAQCTSDSGEGIFTYGAGTLPTSYGDKALPDNAGDLATRFMANCMEGYESDVSVCYNSAPKDGDWDYGNIWTWGWKMGGSHSGSVTGPLRTYLEGLGTSWGLCHVLGESGRTYVDVNADANNVGDVECYEWKLGGAHRSGSGDTCLLQAETYVIVEPRWDETLGRWAFGKCLLNEQGTDLEVKDYGVCESCGYLTMAKQELSAVPSGWVEDYYEPADVANTYHGTYCPDLEISTPYKRANPSDLLYDELYNTHYFDPQPESGEDAEDFYAVEPNGMNGYVNYKFGANYRSGDTANTEECTYPNGYTVMDDWSLGSGNKNQMGLPDTDPNAYYVNKKLESMMKRNIQPVIFATDDYLWKRTAGTSSDLRSVQMKMTSGGEPDSATFNLLKELYDSRGILFESLPSSSDTNSVVYYNSDENSYYAIGTFLGNTIINEGAAILVIDDYRVTCSSEVGCSSAIGYHEEADKRITERGASSRLLCPNCMLAIAVGYQPDSVSDSFNMEKRMGEIDNLFDYATVGGAISSVREPYIDAVALNLELKDGDAYCSLSGEERYAAILANMSYLGTETIKKYQKPIVITDFVIHRNGECWDEESAGELIAYLGMHAKDLSKSGYLGLIYSDWQYDRADQFTSASTDSQIMGTPDDPYLRDSFFEGAYVAARKFAGHSIMTYYTEVPSSEKCTCTPCTAADDPALCNGRYLGSEDFCYGYQDGDYSRWPDNCITEGACTIKGEISYNVQIPCELTYDNGTTEAKTFNSDDVYASPSGYRDVIASLESYSNKHLTWCFPLGGEGWVTYQKSDHHSFESLPAVFSIDGNTSVECDPTSGLLDSFCGYYPPITKYQMTCKFLD